jgi:hypothetical protein
MSFDNARSIVILKMAPLFPAGRSISPAFPCVTQLKAFVSLCVLRTSLRTLC